ncbi:MAG: amidase domain-containing protein [Clostridioides sp.]|jgi:hypothetical protein|nr:amidase domain-containing protein [Clostridioides sp.]
MPYDREAAVTYAHRWAYDRNPRYLNFAGIGGDCTNFVSQCLNAGGCKMNYTKNTGWYYTTSDNRAPAWTGVEFLYSFLMENKGVGPYAEVIKIEDLAPGDVIQLSSNGEIYTHTLLVVEIKEGKTKDDILVAAHSYDSDNRPLSTYSVEMIRYLKIYARE